MILRHCCGSLFAPVRMLALRAEEMKTAGFMPAARQHTRASSLLVVLLVRELLARGEVENLDVAPGGLPPGNHQRLVVLAGVLLDRHRDAVAVLRVIDRPGPVERLVPHLLAGRQVVERN